MSLEPTFEVEAYEDFVVIMACDGILTTKVGIDYSALREIIYELQEMADEAEIRQENYRGTT